MFFSFRRFVYLVSRKVFFSARVCVFFATGCVFLFACFLFFCARGCVFFFLQGIFSFPVGLCFLQDFFFCKGLSFVFDFFFFFCTELFLSALGHFFVARGCVFSCQRVVFCLQWGKFFLLARGCVFSSCNGLCFFFPTCCVPFVSKGFFSFSFQMVLFSYFLGVFSSQVVVFFFFFKGLLFFLKRLRFWRAARACVFLVFARCCVFLCQVLRISFEGVICFCEE